MTTAIGIFAGLMLGSFLSVLLERLGHKDGIVAGRSECPRCHHVLAWYDLIPLLSYLLLRGKCRYCGARIASLYPILEISMAVVLGVYAFRFGIPTPWYAMNLIVLFGLVALFFFDLKYQILPDVITFSLLGLAVIRLVMLRPDLLVNSLATGILLASALGLLYAVSKGRWIGFGDVKLALCIGVLFGYPMAVGVTLLAVWLGALIGVGLLWSGRATMQTAVPFGTFWTSIAIVAVIWPEPVAFVSGLFTPVFL